MTDNLLLGNTIQPQIDAWVAFDWQGQLSAAEATLQQTKEVQKQSLQARKQLAETTKVFKKAFKNAEQASSTLTTDASPENVQTVCKAIDVMAKEVRVTIKAYQEEIDAMTRRCKAAESSYMSLATACFMEQEKKNDPGMVMMQMMKVMETMTEQVEFQKREIQQLKQQQQQPSNISGGSAGSNGSGGGGGGSGLSNKEEREELMSLRKEVAEYEVEFRSLKNQDITIRKLEARIAELQTTGEVQLQEQLEKLKDDLRETEGRRVEQALQREAALERKVQTLELQLKAERAGREATQAHLLQADEGVSHREAAWEAQRVILVDDSMRVREALQAATRERDELRLKVAAIQGGGGNSGGNSKVGMSPPPSGGGVSMADLMLERKAYEAEVGELSETASLLRDELRIKEEMLADEQRTSQAKISSMEREISSLKSSLDELQSQLSTAPSQALVESMKRELRILKRLEYNDADDDVDADRDPEIAGGSYSSSTDEKDLETVLVAKLRRAESDLVTERMSRTDLREQVDSLKQALVLAERAKDEADKLVFKLEKDLELACATPSSPSRTRSAPSEPPIMEENPAVLQSIIDPSGEPVPPVVMPPPVARASSATATEKAEDDHSVATIVMAQRDRLRARCEALEAERDSFKRELQIQVQASESLKTDNTKLYEKVRYLQNYNKSPNSNNNRLRAGVADRDLDLEALEQRYEASVDPFRQFSKAERQRKLNEMSPMERAVFIVAKTTLGTKEMRTALFFYVLALHLLVFVTTYHWSHQSGCHNVNNEHLAFLPHEQQTAAKATDEAKAAET